MNCCGQECLEVKSLSSGHVFHHCEQCGEQYDAPLSDETNLEHSRPTLAFSAVGAKTGRWSAANPPGTAMPRANVPSRAVMDAACLNPCREIYVGDGGRCLLGTEICGHCTSYYLPPYIDMTADMGFCSDACHEAWLQEIDGPSN